MKKRLFSLFTILLIASGLSAQVEFSKFKFSRDSPFGAFPTRKMTNTKFKITADKPIKYIDIYYYGVNEVNDAISSDIVGAVNANAKHTKFKMIKMTGIFEPQKIYSRWASGTFYTGLKVTAFPFRIDITYMDGEKKTYDITEENLNHFFPKLKWIDVNLKDGI